MSRSELKLDLGIVTMNCTPDEVGGVLAALLGEMRTGTLFLSPEERADLRRIMAAESGTLTVAEVFPDFHRESKAHLTLRRLRAAQFVRPARSGRWTDDEPIEIKPFARLMWDRVGEAVIFGDKPEGGRDETPDDDDVIDLGQEQDEDPDAVNLVRPNAGADVVWDDEAVMDFLRDPRESVG